VVVALEGLGQTRRVTCAVLWASRMLMARGDNRGVVVLALGRCRRSKMRMGLVRMEVCLGYWRRYIAGHLVGARVGCSHESESIRVALFNDNLQNLINMAR
jgi:hypothetical protein